MSCRFGVSGFGNPGLAACHHTITFTCLTVFGNAIPYSLALFSLRDTVTVNTSRGNTGPMCTEADLQRSYLYNDGRGIFLKDGKATVDFCSGDMGTVGLVSELQTFLD